MATWTPEQRTRASARAAVLWQARVRADPASHKLKRLRALRDLTGSELAGLAQISQSTVSEIENQKRRPSRGVAERIARVLCVPESEIFA
jgi:DNA-binding XRE family transcriptional regulator